MLLYLRWQRRFSWKFIMKKQGIEFLIIKIVENHLVSLIPQLGNRSVCNGVIETEILHRWW